jgi:hypothetical protein
LSIEPFKHRGQAIVPAVGTPTAKTQTPKVQQKIVENNQYVLRLYLPSGTKSGRCLAAVVHKGLRLDQHHLLTAQLDFGDFGNGVFPVLPVNTAPGRQVIYRHKTYVVPGRRIARTGIAQP